MASTADQLAKLANDDKFKARVQALLVQQAGAVYVESAGTPNHAIRLNYAKAIMQNPNSYSNVTMIIANRTNLVAGNTTFNFKTDHVETDVSDAAISSQIATDWDMLSGV